VTAKCELTGAPARGPIKVDGSDRCFCPACSAAILVERATGNADATAEIINSALNYLGVWNDKPEAIRLLRLARTNVSEIAHKLRQSRGERADQPFTPDPDWAEDDARNEGERDAG
jgi:hypothetical protein